MTGRRVAVIGAGLGGLSAAARLAAAGHSVDVFESQNFPGGKAGSVRHGAYRFDTGPSLVTMPDVLNQLFAETGEARSDYIRLTPLEDICRYFFSDGSTLVSSSDRERFASEIASNTVDTPEALHRFLDYSSRIYRVASGLFLWNSLHEVGTYANPKAIGSILSAARIDPLRTMDRAVRSFFSDPRMVQFFNRYATYNGSNPYQTPATLNIIPHVEYDIGASSADDGIFSIPLGIARLAEWKGVKLHLSTPVRRILTDPVRRKVRGIDVEGEKLDYDAVVSNADVAHTYESLLQDSGARLLRRHLRQEPSSSGLVFYLGMKDSFPELGLHNIFFSSDYRSEFTDIFERRMCPADPTLYVNITSKVTAADAPPGGENWFVLVNAPHDAGQDWQAESARVRGAMFERLSTALGRDVRQSVEEESVMTPADIAARTGSRFGSLYGISSNSRLAAFLRHPNRSNRYPGLYFCGGSVHPGGGMPLVILSGKIAADLLRKDIKRGRL